MFCLGAEMKMLPPTFTSVHAGPGPCVLQLGNWFFGPLLDRECFVFNTRGATQPQLVIDRDGRVFCIFCKGVHIVRTFNEFYCLSQDNNIASLHSYKGLRA